MAAALAAATLTLSRGRDGGGGSCRRAAHRRLGFRSRSVLAPRRRASVDQLGADDQDRPAALGAAVPLGVRGSPLGTGDLDVGARGRRRRGGLHVGPPARGCAHRRRRSARGDRGRPVVDVRSIRAVACRIRRRRLRRCRCVDLGVASASAHRRSARRSGGRRRDRGRCSRITSTHTTGGSSATTSNPTASTAGRCCSGSGRRC